MKRFLPFVLGLAFLLLAADLAEAGGGRLFGRFRGGCSGGGAGVGTYGGCSGMSADYGYSGGCGGMSAGYGWGGGMIYPNGGGYYPTTRPPAPAVSSEGFWHWHQDQRKYHWHSYNQAMPAATEPGPERKKK